MSRWDVSFRPEGGKIYLEAQTYAEGFYMKQGFCRISEEFMLDGIPHYKMLREEEVDER